MAADGLLFVSRLHAGTASSPQVTEKVDFPPTPLSLSGAFLRLFRDLDVPCLCSGFL